MSIPASPPSGRKATILQLAELVGGEVLGDGRVEVTGIASLEAAREGELTFLVEMKNLSRLENSKASAAIIPSSLASFSRPAIRTSNPYLAYARVQSFFVRRPYEATGIDARAVVGAGVKMGREVSLHPLVTVEEGAEIGNRVTLYPGVYLGKGVQVGDDCILHPNVVVLDGCRIGKRVIIHAGSVIGSDGFGFAQDGARSIRIPQVGIVQIDDDVEIGANCTIDRAALDKTWIKRGVKTDNLVHVGHNVVIGEDTLLIAQVGISGSTTVGNRVVLAGQVGVVPHVSIGDGAVVGPQSGIPQDVRPGAVMMGTPAIPHREWLRAQALYTKLPEMKRTLTALEKRIRALEEGAQNEKIKGK